MDKWIRAGDNFYNLTNVSIIAVICRERPQAGWWEIKMVITHTHDRRGTDGISGIQLGAFNCIDEMYALKEYILNMVQDLLDGPCHSLDIVEDIVKYLARTLKEKNK